VKEISEQFSHLYQKIATQNFLKMQSLGGEIPFYISAYDATKEIEIQDAIQLLIKKLDSNGIPVLELNLFDIACEIMEKNGGVERMFKVEKRRSKDKFLRALQSTLNMHDRLMPTLAEKIKTAEAKVYFLTGIAQVFPFIRSHNVLNNLQNIAKEAPTVIFFPGVFNGNDLNLFGMMKDDNYYRAFPIDSIRLQ